MRQRDQVEKAAFATERKGTPHNFIKPFERKKLGDSEFAHGNDKLGLQQLDFVIHPGGTIPDLVRSWNAIAPGRVLAGKAATDGREVNPGADLFLAHAAELLKPTEQGAACGPGERLAEHRFLHAGRLAD